MDSFLLAEEIFEEVFKKPYDAMKITVGEADSFVSILRRTEEMLKAGFTQADTREELVRRMK